MRNITKCPSSTIMHSNQGLQKWCSTIFPGAIINCIWQCIPAYFNNLLLTLFFSIPLDNIYIYTPTKVKHHPIFLSIYLFTSILLKQLNRYHHFSYTSYKTTPRALKLPIYEVFIILKDVTMTWQKWGSKQALEKRKTSLSLMEVFNIALKFRVQILRTFKCIYCAYV